MSGLRPDQIDDLVKLTLRKHQRRMWTDISLPLQQYFAMRNLLPRNPQNISESGGNQLEWQVQVSHSGAASDTGLYATQAVNVAQNFQSATAPWAMQQSHFAYDERENDFNSGPEQIVNLIQTRKHDAMNSMAELLESRFWGFPANDTDQAEKLKPRGVLYYIVKSATKGFNGLYQDGWTSVAGLSPDTYIRWRNYTATYAAITRASLVAELKEALYKTGFVNPDPFPDAGGENMRVQPFQIATTYAVCTKMEELLEQQNDDLGDDLAPFSMARIRRQPITPVPYLDENSGTGTTLDLNPVIGINFQSFKGVFKSGERLRWGPPKDAPFQNRVKHVHLDNSMQFKCTNRRTNFYLYQA